MPLMTNGNKQTDIHNKYEEGLKDVHIVKIFSRQVTMSGR